MLSIPNVKFHTFLIFHYYFWTNLVVVVECNQGQHEYFIHFVIDFHVLVFRKFGVMRMFRAGVAKLFGNLVYRIFVSLCLALNLRSVLFNYRFGLFGDFL